MLECLLDFAQILGRDVGGFEGFHVDAFALHHGEDFLRLSGPTMERGERCSKTAIILRRLRVMDAVIKYITVRTDEEVRRLEKARNFRQKRAARRGSGASAPPAQSIEEAMQ